MRSICFLLGLALVICLAGCSLVANDSDGGDIPPAATEHPGTPVTDPGPDITPVPQEGPFLSAGCGNMNPPEGTRFSVDVDGEERTYLLEIPEDYNPDRPYPIIYGFHGTFGTGQLSRLMYRFKGVVENEAILVYPDGNNNQWGPPDLPFFDVMNERISNDYCIDEGSIFATGLSIGGGMSNLLGCERGDIIRAIAPVAGAGPFDTCNGRVAVMQIHGTNDPVVPIVMSLDGQERWCAASECTSELDEPLETDEETPCMHFAGCHEDFPVVWCEHDRPMGHVWPGWASQAIWDFFRSLRSTPQHEPVGQQLHFGNTLTFSLHVPEEFDQTPISLAATFYAADTKQPIFTAPVKVLRDCLDPGDMVPGATVQYHVEGVSFASCEIPGDYTLAIMLYVEGGGNPIPVAGKEHVGLYPIHIEHDGDQVIDEVIELEPIRYF